MGKISSNFSEAGKIAFEREGIKAGHQGDIMIMMGSQEESEEAQPEALLSPKQSFDSTSASAAAAVGICQG